MVVIAQIYQGKAYESAHQRSPTIHNTVPAGPRRTRGALQRVVLRMVRVMTRHRVHPPYECGTCMCRSIGRRVNVHSLSSHRLGAL
jgi:hypothetical protein